jgi:hypothetical protein
VKSATLVSRISPSLDLVVILLLCSESVLCFQHLKAVDISVSPTAVGLWSTFWSLGHSTLCNSLPWERS